MSDWPTEPSRPLHETTTDGLMLKEAELVNLFIKLRNFIFSLHPDSHELVYNTHALTSVFSHSTKLKHAYCHIPVYTAHLNLGFNKGSLLHDSENRLQGTGKLIRHIPVKSTSDFNNDYVIKLLKEAIAQAQPDQ